MRICADHFFICGQTNQVEKLFKVGSLILMWTAVF